VIQKEKRFQKDFKKISKRFQKDFKKILKRSQCGVNAFIHLDVKPSLKKTLILGGGSVYHGLYGGESRAEHDVSSISSVQSCSHAVTVALTFGLVLFVCRSL
jgi:hypothetical protein